MTEQNRQLSISIDPLKYLNRLPDFNGDYRDLLTFTNLIDRVHPLLTVYDEPSQLLFSDIIKSKLTGKAREIIEINCQAQSWTEVKTVLNNNFGDRCGLEELFDKLKSVTFKNNSVEFYNELKKRLRNLNNKTIVSIGSGPAANECAKNNMKTALNVFKEKIPEPMRTILTCRNPETLEAAMEILFQAGYAYITPPNPMFSTYGRSSPKEFKNVQPNRQLNRNTNNQNNVTRTYSNRNTQKKFSYNQPNYQNPYRNWQERDYRNFNHNQQNGQNYNRQNNWNPFRQDGQITQHDNHLQRPEPMDINTLERPKKHNQIQDENFRSLASGNFHI